MSLTVNENEYGLTVSETPTHSLTVSGTSAPLTIASGDLTLTVSDTPTSLLTVTSSADPSITVQDNNILLTIDQSTGSSSSANPFNQSLNTTDSPTFAAITVSGTVDGRDLSVDGTKLDGIAAQANKYVHPTYTSRSINTSGASVLDEFTSDVAGHVTNITTRTLTLADLGYTGATDANKYVLPTSFTARNINTSGAHVLDTFTSDTSGRVTGVTTRPLLLADIGYTGATNADVTPSWVPSTNPNYLTATSTDLDSRYYTELETNQFLALKAPIASPTFTGVPAAPTATAGTNTTQLATTAFVGTAVAGLVDSAPPLLNTLNELAEALGDDANFSTTIATSISLKAPIASPVFTGTPTAPNLTLTALSPYSGSDVTALMIKSNGVVGKRVLGTAAFSATSDFAAASALGDYYTKTETNGFLNLKANLASPTFTGNVSIAEKLIHTGDTNTYIQFPSTNDKIVFATNGSDVLTLDAANTATFAGNIKLPDATGSGQGILFFGASNDLQVYHDGSNSVLNNTTGNLQIYNNADDGDIQFISDDGSGGVTEYLRLDGGDARMYASREIRFVDGVASKYGNNGDLGIFHDGTNSYLENTTGHIYIRNLADDKSIIFQNDNGSGGYENYFELQGGAGGAFPFTVFPDSSHLVFGNGHDFRIYHNGISYFDNFSGNIEIRQFTNDADIIFKSDDGFGGITEYLRIDGGSTTLQAYKDLLIANDTAKLKLGASQDLQIFHDGSNSYIQDTGTGNLNIQSNSLRLLGADSSAMLVAHQGGAVNLYHNGSAKLETTSSGIYVAGNIQLLDSSSTSFGRITFGHGNDLQIYHDGSDSYIKDVGTGELRISGSATRIYDADMSSLQAEFKDGGSVDLYYDSNKKFATTIDGIQLYGNGYLDMPDNGRIRMGASYDLAIYHDASHSYIDEVGAGDLRIRSNSATALLSSTNENMLVAIANGAVELYFDNSKKLQTETWGVSLTGSTVSSGNVYSGGPAGFVFGSSTSEGEYIYRNGNDIRVFAGGADRLTVDGDGGRVGIGTTNPDASTLLHVQGVIGTTNGSAAAPTHSFYGDPDNGMFRAAANALGFSTSGTERMRISSTGEVVIYSGQLSVTNSTGAQLQVSGWSDRVGSNNSANGTIYIGNTAAYRGVIDYDAASTGNLIISNTWNNANGDIVFKTATADTAIEGLRIKGGGNVGIGVTDPDAKLEIIGSGTGSGAALRVRNSSNTELLQVTDSGVVTVPQGYFYVSSGGGAYVQNALRVRGSLLNDQGTLSITGDVQFDSYTLFVDSAYDRVGVGSSSPSYKLDVNGGIRAGGKVTYHKSAGSLTTTGYAVAGLTSFPAGNGASAGFTFTCFGHTGDYQKIVYSCYNVSGTWNTQKVIDEGTNDFDVTASANGSTITFTFKSRSGTKSYTPRVSVEAFGSSINNTYA